MSAMLRQIIDRFDVMAYPVFALAVFIAVFVAVVARVRRLAPEHTSRMAALPLDDPQERSR